MTRLTFTSRRRAEIALNEIKAATSKVRQGCPIRQVVRELKSKSPRTAIPRSSLQRALKLPLPEIAKTKSGFYLRWRNSKTYTSFTAEEERALVAQIASKLDTMPFLSYNDVRYIAIELRDRICRQSATTATPLYRKRLQAMKFSHHWFSSFIGRHDETLSKLMSRPVDRVRVMAFNAVTLSSFFAQVKLAYHKYNIVHPWQVLNLDETGYTPGRDLNGKVPERVVTKSGHRAVWPRVSFKYENRISILLCVGADGMEYLPAAVFKGVREPTLSDYVSRIRVSELMPSGWVCFWRKEVASVDGNIFHKWVQKFVPIARRGREPNVWMLLFYDACRSHMTTKSIQALRDARIAVIALPAHTSDNLQPCDVSIFGPMRHYVNVNVTERVLQERRDGLTSKGLSGIAVWGAILEGHDKAVNCKNIQSGFAKSGLFPICLKALIGDSVRKSYHEEQVCSLASLINDTKACMLDYKRHGEPEAVVKCGFVDTTYGIDLTRQEVLDVLKGLELDRAQQNKEKERDADLRRASELADREARRSFAEKVQLSKAIDRQMRWGLPGILPRSFKDRRLAVKLLLEKKRIQRAFAEHLEGELQNT